MPFYAGVDEESVNGKRALDRLIKLRAHLDRDVPARSDEMIVLGTWNIREFDSPAYGRRVPEAMHYIAEIVARFDIIAITEVRSDLRAFKILLDLLGPRWEYVVSDVTSGRGGNGERIAVVFDNTKVRFGGLAGELVLPPVRTKDAQGKKIEVPAAQFARTPMLAGFTAGTVDFMLAVVHVRWGDGSKDPRAEVEQLIKEFTRKADERQAWSHNIIAIGDFNIGAPTDIAFDALRAKGWVLPAKFAEGIEGTNIAQNKFYDQIAVRPRPGKFELGSVEKFESAGVFNCYQTIFRPNADFETYIPLMKEVKPTSKTSNFTFDSKGRSRSVDSQRVWYRNYWRTHQISDHLPLWATIRIDNTDHDLQSRLDAVS